MAGSLEVPGSSMYTAINRKAPQTRKELKCFLTEVQDLGFLNRLESLKLSVHRDYVRHLIRLPLNLKKLTVSGFYMSREQMNIIGRLPNRVVLKLREGSFHRRQWNTTEGEFQQLKFLELFSVQNTEWNASSDHFPRLQRLVLRHCKSLEKIPSSFCDILSLLIIEVHHCQQSVAESAMQIQEEQRDMGNDELQVIIST
ncbi:putative late blight resistance protein-like protein R1A-6 [Forsythia ovata]|uniref:Late blight resistance protein-like protein R1A-6 n=1 Tax=Forsythia ovata TaxID=205694 RepID=A0ABD1TUR2_9LAMI